MDLSNSSRRVRFVGMITYTHTHTHTHTHIQSSLKCLEGPPVWTGRDGNTLVSVMIKVLEGTADYLDNKSIVTAVR